MYNLQAYMTKTCNINKTNVSNIRYKQHMAAYYQLQQSK